eukprot:740274_1
MRSVNQRYLETYFRLPEQFRSLEPVVRERIRSRLTRGKVECTLRYEPDVSAQGELILNEKLAKQLVTAANWVKMQSDEGEINPVDILRWPGVMAAQEQDLDAIAAEILAALDGTLNDFIVARETEGQALKALIEQRLEGVTAEVVKVRSHMPEILQWQRERLVAKLEDAQVQLENNRLEQELVLLAQRIDVAEELDRLDAQKTVVTAVSQAVRHGASDAPLRLNGEDLKLVSVHINDEPWTAWKEEEGVLVISNLPERFTLKIINEISPAANTALEGLYQSGDALCTQCEAEGFRHITYYLDHPDVLA